MCVSETRERVRSGDETQVLLHAHTQHGTAACVLHQSRTRVTLAIHVTVPGTVLVGHVMSCAHRDGRERQRACCRGYAAQEDSTHERTWCVASTLDATTYTMNSVMATMLKRTGAPPRYVW